MHGAEPASARPRLVFIHGTKGHIKKTKWLTPLNRSLEQIGVDPWDESEIIDPNYKPLLKRPRDMKRGRPSRDGAPACRKAEFEAHRRELSKILGKFGTTKKATGQRVPARARGIALVVARLLTEFRKTARKYLRRRNQVCQLIRSELEAAGPGDFIVIGYSLGSVIAADLLPRLGPGQHVRLLVTVGSPLGVGKWNRTIRVLRGRRFPYDQVDAWVNIHNRRDWITGRVGLEQRIPQAIDVRIGRFPQPSNPRREPRKALLAQHRIGGYARHASLATAIAWAIG